MRLTLEHHGTKYDCSTNEAKSIAIGLDFEGPQPNHFGTDKASSAVLKLGGFIGDTKQGGSCNVDVLKMIPHCNGTHTETVSHIVNEDIWVGHAALDFLTLAMVVTVEPELGETTGQTYRPALDNADSVITSEILLNSIANVGDSAAIRPGALIVRTLPNHVAKISRAYNAENLPPFFTVEAIEAINDLGIRHLVVDFPSVDRMNDDGLLTNHHIFWNVIEKSHELSGESWQDKTITEMAYIQDEIPDGIYALNLQVPAFGNDAAPSRPVIIPVTAHASSK